MQILSRDHKIRVGHSRRLSLFWPSRFFAASLVSTKHSLPRKVDRHFWDRNLCVYRPLPWIVHRWLLIRNIDFLLGVCLLIFWKRGSGLIWNSMHLVWPLVTLNNWEISCHLTVCVFSLRFFGIFHYSIKLFEFMNHGDRMEIRSNGFWTRIWDRKSNYHIFVSHLVSTTYLRYCSLVWLWIFSIKLWIFDYDYRSLLRIYWLSLSLYNWLQSIIQNPGKYLIIHNKVSYLLLI